jgi:hypothetical protein
MNTLKLYLSAGFDLALIIVATLAEIDLEIRIVAGAVGVVLGILTSIKFIQDIKIKREDLKIKSMERKQKEFDFEERIRKRYENN